MSYTGDLSFLIRGLSQGAIEGDAGLDMLMQLKASKAEAEMARRQARQEALMEQRQAAAEAAQSAQKGLMGDLETMLMGADDTPLPELQREMAARIQLGGVAPSRRNARQVSGALESLYGNSYFPQAGQKLPHSDYADIRKNVSQWRRTMGLPDVIERLRQGWTRAAATDPNAADWEDVADEVIAEALRVYNERDAGPASYNPF